MKKRTLFVIFGVAIGTWGCSFSAGIIPTPTQTLVNEVGTVVAATMQAYTASPTEGISTQVVTSPAATQEGGIPVSSGGVSFVIPGGLAGGANAETMTAVDSNSGAPWDIAPTHLSLH